MRINLVITIIMKAKIKGMITILIIIIETINVITIVIITSITAIIEKTHITMVILTVITLENLIQMKILKDNPMKIITMDHTVIIIDANIKETKDSIMVKATKITIVTMIKVIKDLSLIIMITMLTITKEKVHSRQKTRPGNC